MSRHPRYRAYGLTIESEIALSVPSEPEPGRTPDLTIREGPLLEAPPGAGSDIAVVSPLLRLAFRAADHWEIHACGFDPAQRYAASVRPGRVDVGWNAGVLRDDVARHLVSLVLAAHAYVRGGVCLHGCAVATGDRATLVLGASGRGKSILAAAMIADGARLVSEEIVMLDADPLTVVAGTPAVKICPQVAAVLGFAGRTRPAYAHADYGHEGVLVDLDGAQFVSRAALPIGEIILLGQRHGGERPALSSPLPAVQAAAALADCGYWMPHLPPEARGNVMKAALEIACRRPVRTLSLPDDVSALPQATRLLSRRLMSGRP